MKPTIAQKYRTQAIDLQPYGNTISVEASSDNPFESDQDVEIFTQASGGMAGPDPRMRSRGLLVSRPKNRGHHNGKARTYRVNQDSAHNGFFPGMGDLDGTGRRVRKTRMISRNGFMPGFGDLDGGARRAMRSRRISNNGFFPGMGDVPGASATPTWLQALTGAAQTAGGIVGQRYDAKTAASMAAAEQARADQQRSQALMSASLMSRTGDSMGQHKTLVIGLGVVAAAAIAYALFLRKK